MATSSLQNAYSAAQQSILTLWVLVTKEAAASNFGTDFRVSAGTESYQIQVRHDGIEISQSNVNYFRVRVTMLFHHKRTSLADERTWMYTTLNPFRLLTAHLQWTQQAHVYDLADEDGDPESSDIEREGNVLTWTFGITLLVDNLD